MKSKAVRIGISVGACFLALSLLMVATRPAKAADKPAPKYVGAMTCAKICHKTAKQGKQLSIWQGSSHAKAFETLASAEAKKIGADKGIADVRQIMTALKDNDFEGYLSIEDLRKDVPAEGKVRPAIEYLKGLEDSEERFMPV